jgi:hypothetical protein
MADNVIPNMTNDVYFDLIKPMTMTIPIVGPTIHWLSIKLTSKEQDFE